MAFYPRTEYILIGISWRWWRHRHSKHHQETNVITADPDLKTNPFLVYDEKLETGDLTEIQRKLLPLYLSIYIIVWRIASIVKCLKKGWWSDVVFTIFHWVFVASFFTYFSLYSSKELAMMLFTREAIAGHYLGIVFMMNHFLEEVLPEEHCLNSTIQILKTTRNINCTNKIRNIMWVAFTGGLSLQIEHHFFPSCPIDKLPQLASIVEKVCKKRGLPYITSSPNKTLSDIWSRLGEIEQVAANRREKAVYQM